MSKRKGNSRNSIERAGECSCLNMPIGRRGLLKTAAVALGPIVGVPAICGFNTSLNRVLAATFEESAGSTGTPSGAPSLFPKPRELKVGENSFTVDGETSIFLPANASADDHHLSRCLTNDLSDWHDVQVRVQRVSRLPEKGKFILMGSIANPLVREYCARLDTTITETAPGPEGYLLQVDPHAILVAGCDAKGAFYGAQSLRQLIKKTDQKIAIQCLEVRDWPDKTFRGVKLYLPGRVNIPFFKRFVRDFMAVYKYNTLMMEMNACMRLDRHPELNAGWVEFSRDTNFSRRNYPPGVPHEVEVNSSHQDTADGGFLEKDEVVDLVRWTNQNHIEVVPEIPSLTHSFYLLSKHRDLAQVPDVKWPDTYCACNPKSYELLFDVMDEYIEVMKPKMIHAGHDEWFAPFGLGPCCKDKDPGEVYGEDLKKVHGYLATKGIRMAIWGDYLLERVRGKGLQKRTAPDGFVYQAPGAMTPQQVKALVPKDILIFNWFWSEEEGGESTEAQLEEMGFHQVYGNMTPFVQNYQARSKRSTVIGGAPSSWAATTEFNMGKDLIRDILGCSSLLWSRRSLEPKELSILTQTLMPGIRMGLTGQVPPSETGDPVLPIDISSSFNMPLQESSLSMDLGGMKPGRIVMGNKVFDLTSSAEGKAVIMVGAEGETPNPLPREVTGIKIGKDATSLVFLHACAKPATNKEAYRLIWDFEDSADLLGWYEVVYEDGLPEVIPVRYGINILEWNWGSNQSSVAYCFGADPVNCSQGGRNPITFFAIEWVNPRLGKVIREVRLRGSTRFRGAVAGFENAFGDIIPNNAIILKAISFVKRRG
ncbi:MAG TPA: glycoside hydrolase family 20 zincin-like fold domain-containing protein [Terriglobia bacterium]|nr:glycoside hydrolase family 20 zincin-like fold domain-containing protein [Terriglobia bacterium]